MQQKLKWRLSKLPTPSELVELVNNKLITQEEAKEILFDLRTEADVDTEALKKEIEFLRKVVEDLSSTRTQTIRVIEKNINNYSGWGWYQPYVTYCTTGDLAGTGGITLSGSGGTNLSASSGVSATATTNCSLTTVKTF
jgi:hypothetical protein